jgi:3-oxoacyl-[acyl-carrier protein] reductase
MLLESKIALIYGAGGAIGGAVARAFAGEGARVYLAGRTRAPVDTVADEIGASGAAQVDALDERAVEQHVGDVVDDAGRIDVLFSAIGMEDVQGTPLVEMPLEDLAHPVIMATKTQFATARAVARRMIGEGAGVIMSVTAEPSPAANVGGFVAACAAVEGLWRSFAKELGPFGIRLVILRSAGSPDTPGVQEVLKRHAAAAGAPLEEYAAKAGSRSTLLGRLPRVAEVASAATILASDRASAMTGTLANVTCGAWIDV